MAARSLCILALLAVLILSGCGGGGSSPELVLGDYYPLLVGAVWTYNTVLQAETQTVNFSTTGTMRRELVSLQNLNLGPDVFTCYVFQHDYTANDFPYLDAASRPVEPFIQYLFSANGGLHSVRSYYRIVPAAANFPAHLELVALQRVGEPVVRVPAPRPYLFTPAYHGVMQAASLWFTPMPLMPFVTDLSSVEEHDKTLNYGTSGGIGGSTNCIINIHYYGANLNVDDGVAAIAGRGRTFYKDGVGLWGFDVQSEWYGTINVGGLTSRVTSSLELTSYTPPGP